MSARSRATEDVESGDLGLARKRLMSLATSRGYDAKLIEEIARLSVRMGDLTEAGRWYLLCDSRDEAAQECMARFLRSCGGRVEHAVAQLPLKRQINKDRASIPKVVRERLEATPTTRAILARAGSMSAPKAGSTWRGRLLGLGCLTAIILFVIFAAIGVSATVHFFGW